MRRLLVGAVFLVLIIGCGSDAGAGDPARVVESYIESKANGDAAGIQALLCSEMEAQLEREIHTFDSVSGVAVEGMLCTVESEGLVRCEGAIVAEYGTESTRFPLTRYRVVREDGEWKWCGEG